MEKQHHNPLTLADLKEALKGLAKDLNALAPQETVNAIMETVAETKEGMTALTGLMQEMLGELTATHEDVRAVHCTVTMLVTGDAVHEAAIESLRKRLERVGRHRHSRHRARRKKLPANGGFSLLSVCSPARVHPCMCPDDRVDSAAQQAATVLPWGIRAPCGSPPRALP
jgi:hypothetical protein